MGVLDCIVQEETEYQGSYTFIEDTTCSNGRDTVNTVILMQSQKDPPFACLMLPQLTVVK